MADVYPELRRDLATILRTLPEHPQLIIDLQAERRRFGADLLDYVESTESGDGVHLARVWELEAQIETMEAERDANKDDLDEANSKYAELRDLVGIWAEQIDELDVDSETRDDLRPIIERMRKIANDKPKPGKSL